VTAYPSSISDLVSKDDVMTETTETTAATETADALEWRPRPLPDGVAWLGVQDSGEQLLVRVWDRDGAGRAVVEHAWVIGRAGSGKSATVRALLGGDLVAGREVLILVDGSGTMGQSLARWSPTGTIARTAQEWADAISLAYAVLQARLARLATGSPWTGPTRTDPIVTLFVDQAGTVAAALPAAQTAMVAEIARTGRALGVRVVQSAGTPLAEDVIGGSEFRGQCRIVLGHAVTDGVHDRIAVQGVDADGVSLVGLRPGQVVVVVDGKAARGQVAWVSEDALAAAATGTPCLSPADLTGDVERLLDGAGHGAELDGPLDPTEADKADEPAGEARRVVFGDELATGAVLFLRCHGPVCEYPAPSCRVGRLGERPDHRVTLTRLRRRGNGLTGVVVDADGAERPWRAWADGPVTVAADTITGQDDDEAGPGDAWAGIPADPRWDPYQLWVRRARWWRPWWTVRVDYVGLWASAGDQTIIVVRSRDVVRARALAVDTLIDHCQWLAAQGEYAADAVPVLWQGAGLVPVAHLAGRSMHQWPTRNCAAVDAAGGAGEAVNAR
jgi:hypothetical protein